MLASWGLVLVIAVLGVGTARAGYPWRQFIDLGVGVGLSLGVLSTAYFTYLAAAGALPDIDGQFSAQSRSWEDISCPSDDDESLPVKVGFSEAVSDQQVSKVPQPFGD